jgi:hypothetical protein
LSDAFDPYHRWLGIPPNDRPPNHYRLLALEAFESDEEVIRSAADRQMGHLRTFQTGRNAAFSQKLLNEVAAARVCLLAPAKKSEYDAWLARQQAAPPAARGVESSGAAAPMFDAEMDGVVEEVLSRSPSGYLRRRRRANIGAIIGAIAVLIGVAALAVVFAIANRPARDSSGAPPSAESPAAPASGAKKPPPAPATEPGARREH